MSAEAISESRAKSDFWQGVRLSMPVVVASAPFAVLFGARPEGVACPLAHFACPFGANAVAVVRAEDRPGGALGFRFLVLARELYRYLGDPFAVADRYPADWYASGRLPDLAWPEEVLPERTLEQLDAVLKHGDDPPHARPRRAKLRSQSGERLPPAKMRDAIDQRDRQVDTVLSFARHIASPGSKASVVAKAVECASPKSRTGPANTFPPPFRNRRRAGR